MFPRNLVLGLALAATAWGQTFTARVTGTITDPSRAAIPGATITARQVETNVSRSARSGPQGVYTIPLLLPGNYEVTVEAAGMQSQVRKDVRLEVNQAVTLDFSLPVAQLATVVDVTAEVPLLQSETSNVGTTLEARLIEDYPLVERDVMSMVRALPGIITNATVGAARGGRNVFDSEFSVAGGRSSTNEVLLDGAANTIGDFNGVVVVPPVDSVQEFRVETSSYSAEFGRSGGGAVNIVTKAGTSRYHGVAYYYGQNTALNANSFDNNRVGVPRARLRRHQYGGTLGGPVLIPRLYQGKDKTFFFASFEGRRENNPAQALSSSPTPRELAGDFSQTVVLVAGTPQYVQIFDPTTSRNAGGQRTRDPFPDNMIPSDRINAISKRILQDYPAANRPGDSLTHRQNYYFSDSEHYSRDVFSGRVDHYFSGSHRFFGRVNWQENLDKNPGQIVQFASTLSLLDNFRNVGLDDTYQITSRLSNVFRYSYTRFRANQFPRATLGFDPTQLGLPSYYRDTSNVLFYPNVSFGSPFTAMGGTAYNNQPRDTQGFQEQLIWIKGRHNLRGGAEYRFLAAPRGIGGQTLLVETRDSTLCPHL